MFDQIGSVGGLVNDNKSIIDIISYSYKCKFEPYIHNIYHTCQ